MKVTINTNELIKSLRLMKDTAGSSTLPILGCANLGAMKDAGGLHIRATDLEVHAFSKVPAGVLEEGACAVPIAPLLKFCATLDKTGDVALTHGKDGLTVSQSGVDMTFATLDAKGMTMLPDTKRKPEWRNKVPLRTLLEHTSFAMSTDETRHVLNGVYLSCETDAYVAVATDGRRLVECKLTPGPCRSPGAFVIRSKAVELLLKYLPKSGNVPVAVHRAILPPEHKDPERIDWMTVVLDDHMLVIKQISGDYPNYKRVIPDGAAVRHSVRVRRHDFMAAVKQACLATTAGAMGCAFAVDPTGQISLLAGRNGSTFKRTLPAHCTGNGVTISINPFYIRDAVSILSEEEVTMRVIDELSPIIIDGATTTQVIMPMRTS